MDDAQPEFLSRAHQPNLLDVDWSKIPAPVDDGAAKHLVGMMLPDIVLPSTKGAGVSLVTLAGRTVREG